MSPSRLRNEGLRDKYPDLSDAQIMRIEQLKAEARRRQSTDGHLPDSKHCLCDGCREKRKQVEVAK